MHTDRPDSPYFFHCTDGEKTFGDTTGARLADKKAAMAHAEQIATDLRADPEYANYTVVVVDERETEIGRVPVSPRQ